MVALENKPCKMNNYSDVGSDVSIHFIGCIPTGDSTKSMQGCNL